jgi:cytochrome c-type biogenesis protein CcmE
MNPVRKKRLYAVVLLVLGVSAAVALALVALQQNINLFFSPSQIAAGEAPVGRRIRGGGLVVPGSVVRDRDSLQVSFAISDGGSTVPVRFTGILPDLFREGQGIVATGTLDEAGVFQAAEVLAKHDENYMPPEVQGAIEAAGHSRKEG